MSEKVKLNFKLGDQKFSYNGHVEKREQDFFQMYYKMEGKDISPTSEQVFRCWKQNFPDSGRDEDSVFVEYQKEVEKQNRKKKQKEDDKKGKDKEERKKKKPEKETEKDAERAAATIEANKVLDDFINEVINAPTKQTPSLFNPPPQTKPAPARPTTYQLKVKLENAEGQKMVLAKPSMTRDELISEIDKKWDATNLLGPDFIAAYEDEEGDRIEIDDTDTLQIFLESIPEGKKGKIIVSKKPTESIPCAAAPEAISTPESSMIQPPSIQTANETAPPSETPAQTSTPAADKNNQETKEDSNQEACPNPKETKDEYDYEADLPKAKMIKTLEGHKMAVFCAAFSPNGDKLVSSSKDRILKIWDVKTEKALFSIKNHNGFVLSCDFADNNNLVVSASEDHTAKIWNVSNGKKKGSLKQHKDKVYCAQFTRGSRHIGTVSIDKTAKVWDVETTKVVVSLEKHTLPVYSCSFDTDGKFYATASDDHTVKLWDWRQNVEIATLTGHKETIWSVNFSKDGRHLVSGSMGHEVVLWDFNERKMIKNIKARKPVHDTRFVKDDKYFLSSGRDNCMCMWDTSTLDLVSVTTAHQQIVYHTAYHHETSTLVSTSLDSTMKLWQFPNLP